MVTKLPKPTYLKLSVVYNDEGGCFGTLTWRYKAKWKDCFNQHCCIFGVGVDAKKHTTGHTWYEFDDLSPGVHVFKVQAHSQHEEIPECPTREDSDIATKKYTVAIKCKRKRVKKTYPGERW